eukprot:TRINITY_DN74471_c0_g1_i1.p1 TRINITY_DN74471_c0_g1~~TRINITY_DN74471_c0_g1_i1.p1  ORF type:complete len:171 (+),score=28.77 TRINITY_DN74471_c0_g1_i1:66-578(+)
MPGERRGVKKKTKGKATSKATSAETASPASPPASPAQARGMLRALLRPAVAENTELRGLASAVAGSEASQEGDYRTLMRGLRACAETSLADAAPPSSCGSGCSSSSESDADSASDVDGGDGECEQASQEPAAAHEDAVRALELALRRSPRCRRARVRVVRLRRLDDLESV